ncbi:MAG: hypothetical protein M3Y32_11500, partial [Pseudomonadota bacterium]|nr:hypothetical protein [Pseudomonadota bacterium]
GGGLRQHDPATSVIAASQITAWGSIALPSPAVFEALGKSVALPHHLKPTATVSTTEDSL